MNFQTFTKRLLSLSTIFLSGWLAGGGIATAAELLDVPVPAAGEEAVPEAAIVLQILKSSDHVTSDTPFQRSAVAGSGIAAAPYSDTVPLSPATGFAGTSFFGGYEFSTTGPTRNFTRQQIRNNNHTPDGTDQIYFQVASTSGWDEAVLAFRGLVLFPRSTFAEAYRPANLRLAGLAAETTGFTTNPAEHFSGRFVVRIGQDYFVSNTAFQLDAADGQLALDAAALATEKWAPYDPFAGLDFDPDTAVFGTLVLEKISGIGLHFEAQNWQANTANVAQFGLGIRSFEASAVVIPGDPDPDPDPVGELFLNFAKTDTHVSADAPFARAAEAGAGLAATPFNDSLLLSPASAYDGPVFVGGYEFATTGPTRNFTRQQIRNNNSTPDGTDQIYFQVASSSGWDDASLAFRAMVVFPKTAFINGFDEGSLRLTDLAAETTGFTTNPADHFSGRFAVRINGIYYLSETTFNLDATDGQLHLDAADLDTERWAPFDPASSLDFDPASAVFVTLTLDHVTAVGLHAEAENWLANTANLAQFGFGIRAFAARGEAIPAAAWTWFEYYPETLWTYTGAFLGWIYPAGDWVYVWDLDKYIFLPEGLVDEVGGWAFVPGTIPGPGTIPTEGFWAGFAISDAGEADTGEFLGHVTVLGDYVFVHDLDKYIFLPESHITSTGGWAYIPMDGANAWRSILYSEDWTAPGESDESTPSFDSDGFLQDFSYAGYQMGEADIPEAPEAVVFNVLDYAADPTGALDSTTAIQQAIDAAAADPSSGHRVVFLPEGTYAIQPPNAGASCLQLRSSRLILRGAGKDKTFLLNTSTQMRSASIIDAISPSLPNWRSDGSPLSAITADLTGPTRIIPVTNSTRFGVGNTIIVAADVNDAWIADHLEPNWASKKSDISGARYFRRIVAIDHTAGTLEIDIPIRYSVLQAYNARVFLKQGMLEEVGIEELSIANSEHPASDGWEFMDFADPAKAAYDVHDSYGITMKHVLNGWIRSVDSFQPSGNATGAHLLSNGILLDQCRNVTVADCTFSDPQYGGGGGNGYMFRLDNANENLFRDCTAQRSRHGFSLALMSTSGNVLLRCTDRDTGIQAAGSGTTNGRGSDHHMWFSHSNLLDSCIAENSWFEARDRFTTASDSQHNTTAAHTVFWNTEGRATLPVPAPYVVWSEQARFGYVIGTSGEVSNVRTTGNQPQRVSVFAPADFVEGVGEGRRLSPASLYLDQLQRRLNP